MKGPSEKNSEIRRHRFRENAGTSTTATTRSDKEGLANNNAAANRIVQSAMNSQVQVVATQFAGHSGFGGVAIHRYNAAYLSGQPNWPLPGQ